MNLKVLWQIIFHTATGFIFYNLETVMSAHLNAPLPVSFIKELTSNHMIFEIKY